MANHQRFQTPNGPVHVFIPDGYTHGGTVVYVHGYYDNVDTAWTNHKLQAQFEASGRDAMFIAIEAPQKKGDSVRWTSLSALLDDVQFRLGIKPPDNVCAVAHSAGFETVAQWLGDSRLRTIILLDALYGYVQKYLAWAMEPGHEITIVVTKTGGTKDNSINLIDALKSLAARNIGDVLRAGITTFKALLVLSDKGHMTLVDSTQTGPVKNWTMPSLLASRSRIGATGSLLRSVVLGVAGFAAVAILFFRRS